MEGYNVYSHERLQFSPLYPQQISHLISYPFLFILFNNLTNPVSVACMQMDVGWTHEHKEPMVSPLKKGDSRYPGSHHQFGSLARGSVSRCHLSSVLKF